MLINSEHSYSATYYKDNFCFRSGKFIVLEFTTDIAYNDEQNLLQQASS